MRPSSTSHAFRCLSVAVALASASVAGATGSFAQSVEQKPQSVGIIVPPAGWPETPTLPRRTLFGGVAEEGWSSPSNNLLYLLTQTIAMQATISKNGAHKTMSVTDQPGTLNLRENLVQTVRQSVYVRQVIGSVSTRLCHGHVGALASFVLGKDGTQSAIATIAADRSGPYLVEAAYVQFHSSAPEPAGLHALTTLCAPSPAELVKRFASKPAQ